MCVYPDVMFKSQLDKHPGVTAYFTFSVQCNSTLFVETLTIKIVCVRFDIQSLTLEEALRQQWQGKTPLMVKEEKRRIDKMEESAVFIYVTALILLGKVYYFSGDRQV